MADIGISLSKGEGIVLSKEQPISLTKSNSYSGNLHINLNWNQPTSPGVPGIDLDLCCLYHLKNDRKGSVQALGNLFGSLDEPPYLKLDGDDRTGAAENGENIILNMDKVQHIQRLLIFAHIYKGTPDWKTANPIVTIKCPGHRDIIVSNDVFTSRTDRICAIAMLDNHGDVTFKLTKLFTFFPKHSQMDRAYDWGLTWKPCSK